MEVKCESRTATTDVVTVNTRLADGITLVHQVHYKQATFTALFQNLFWWDTEQRR
jgi:hypothetical protein